MIRWKPWFASAALLAALASSSALAQDDKSAPAPSPSIETAAPAAPIEQQSQPPQQGVKAFSPMPADSGRKCGGWEDKIS